MKTTIFTVQDFVEEYNRCIDWNIEIRKNMDIKKLETNPITIQLLNLLDDYIPTEKITPEGYCLEDAEVFECEKTGRYELQAYSNTIYRTIYFWCTPGMTKEEYIKERLRPLYNEIIENLGEAQNEIQKLRTKTDALQLLAREVLCLGVD